MRIEDLLNKYRSYIYLSTTNGNGAYGFILRKGNVGIHFDITINKNKIERYELNRLIFESDYYFKDIGKYLVKGIETIENLDSFIINYFINEEK